MTLHNPDWVWRTGEEVMKLTEPPPPTPIPRCLPNLGFCLSFCHYSYDSSSVREEGGRGRDGGKS